MNPADSRQMGCLWPMAAEVTPAVTRGTCFITHQLLTCVHLHLLIQQIVHVSGSISSPILKSRAQTLKARFLTSRPFRPPPWRRSPSSNDHFSELLHHTCCSNCTVMKSRDSEFTHDYARERRTSQPPTFLHPTGSPSTTPALLPWGSERTLGDPLSPCQEPCLSFSCPGPLL